MKRGSIALLLPVLLCASALCVARGQNDADAQHVWTDFQAAVKAGDRAKIASFMRFPLDGWDEADIQGVTQDDFTKSYAKMFTPFVKRMIAEGVLEKQDDTTFAVTRMGIGKHRREMYSLFVEYDAATGYKVTALAIGDVHAK